MELNKRVVIVEALLYLPLYFLFDSVEAHFLLITVFLLWGLYLFKFKPSSPFVWISSAMYLYNATIYSLEFLGLIYYPHIDTILTSVFLSLFTFLFFFVLSSTPPNNISIPTRKIDKLSFRTMQLLLVVMLLWLVAHMFLFQKLGYTSKMEMNMSGGVGILDYLSRWYSIIYTYYIICYINIKGKFPFFFAILTLFVSLGISVIVGERDVFLTNALCSFLVYSMYYRMSRKEMLVFVALGLIMVSILADTKQITNREEIQLGIMEKNPIESVVDSEFGTSGGNFETLLENKSKWDYQYGYSLVKDVLRSVVPPFIFSFEHSTAWFNKLFNSRLSEGYGMGFTFLGEGYIQMGYLGVILWSLLLSVTIYVIYSYSTKSIFGLAVYIYMICISIYAMRGDFSYILSPLIKQILLVYILLKYLFKVRII